MKEKLTNAILKVAEVLQMNKYLAAIRNGFTTLLPIIICGSFCSLMLSVVCSTTTTGFSLAKFHGLEWLAKLTPIFDAANYATMNFLAIGLVVLIAMDLGRHYGHKDPCLPIVALGAYIALCSTVVTGTTESGEAYTVANVLAVNFTNSKGLFMAIIAGITSSELYLHLMKSKHLLIKMPDSVPPNVTASFASLFPGMLTVLIFAAFSFGFESIFKLSVNDAITMCIQVPLSKIITTVPGFIALFMFSNILWSFGIHGPQVLQPIYTATMLQALQENTDAVLAGAQATNIFNRSFISVFSAGTGAGMTGMLALAILLFSKREDQRAVSKLSIAPGLFNINEPMIFGIPIVMNPIYCIPFILAPAVSITFGYVMTAIGFAKPMAYAVPATTPIILKSFLATAGDIPTMITEIMALFLVFLLYVPFVLISNKQAAEEKKQQEETA